jgi:type IV fimbrial biogenesis protein FimT
MQRNALHALFAPENGFTLIELLVTLALTLTLLGIGIPSLQSLAAGSRQTAEINSFVRHLKLARSEAVKSGRDHVLCPSADLIHCQDGSAWQQGFILFEDVNEDGERGMDEPLNHINRPTRQIGIDMLSTEGRTHITFRADGRSAGSNLTLTFCDLAGAVPPKAVILSNSGRARISPTDPDGNPLSCDG